MRTSLNLRFFFFLILCTSLLLYLSNNELRVAWWCLGLSICNGFVFSFFYYFCFFQWSWVRDLGF